MITYLIIGLPIQAREINFTLENNSVGFRQIDNFFAKTKFVAQEKVSQEEFYLINQNNKFLLREVFNSSQFIKIHSLYLLALPRKEALAALSFEYLLESNENLLRFDEPVFYVVLRKESLSELIFAKTIVQSGFSWNKVILDLKNYDTREADLIFYVGNLGDEEKPSTVYLRNLSSQIIILEPSDYLLIEDQELKKLSKYIEKGSIDFFDQTWPIYTFSTHLIDDLMAIRESDGSLTLSFSIPKEDYFKNSLWKLSCGNGLDRFISQNNFYLLPDLVIRDFWPNLTEKVLINVQDFVCTDLSLLNLERF